MISIRFFVRALLFVASAVLGAGLFILAWSHGSDVSANTSSITGIGLSAPLMAVALAFPAIYLLWEQSEL